jgi:hypothetical protein
MQTGSCPDEAIYIRGMVGEGGAMATCVKMQAVQAALTFRPCRVARQRRQAEAVLGVG